MESTELTAIQGAILGTMRKRIDVSFVKSTINVLE